MRASSTSVLRSGGLVKTEQLLREGSSARELRDAVKAGALVRVRKGWYALPGVDTGVERAFRVGGALACANAAVAHGLWVPRFSGLHIAVRPHASRLRDPDRHAVRLSEDLDVVVHWSKDAPRPCELVQAIEDCLVEAASCRGAEFAFVLLESALHRRLLGAAGRARILARLAVPLRLLLRPAGGSSESGLESMVAFRLRALGIAYRQQVRIGRRRVDLLIGEVLALEVDGAAFHDPDRDDRRDVELGLLGYRVRHYRTSLVLDHWPLVEADILAALSRGDHVRS
ncbi:type IV toxin-antitoxin system AbiEi family antitoxin domain-containing protein [Rathayibacter sp. VKM Ac-2760]|uniref:type IV toxin-antitoxin system AbiEi family antitoxin domain-containing protein n=1 Tax=Rathayibacter sp. VKM Ac-2760 TaxID=2609253 RepID=UPI001318353C|nr:type IV toxin-antitoxin system AbiEi family antitoxin domain-containing protein [Rathayibacter sp. VKM Ac-2760]QHC58270.1 DUF559 domain-containing protein [Rathayibacter sp. VKM Ac-2760]